MITLHDRLLVEATRRYEQRLLEAGAAADVEAIADRDANDAAKAAGGSFEHRLVERARRLPIASPLREALQRVAHVRGAVIVAAIIVGVMGGGAAARAALLHPPGVPVNVFGALIGLLGIQIVLLAAWIVAMLVRWRSAPAVSLGSLVMNGARRLASRLTAGTAVSAAAVEANAVVYGRGRLGRWTFATITHLLWTAFNIGAVVVLLIMLSTRYYTFAWETTILSADAFRTVTETLATGPRAVGFPAPTPEQVAASQWTGAGEGAGAAEAARRAWSGFLIGTLVLYGLGPRLVLVLLSIARQHAWARRYRVDLDDPAIERLRDVLMPGSSRLPVAADGYEPDDERGEAAPAERTAGAMTPAAARGGPPDLLYVLGYEVDPPASGWPPPIDRAPWRDLGLIESREDRRRLDAALAHSSTRSATIVIVCAIANTPDRGVSAFFETLRAHHPQRLIVLLTGGEAYRRRTAGADVETRLADWRRAADHAGIRAVDVIDVDLDHLTPESTTRAAAVLRLETGASTATGASRLAAAFDLIVRHVREQRDPADPARQVELHRAIAHLYRARGREPGLPGLFRASLPVDDPAALATTLRERAERVQALLPERLRASPRWLVGGALAGAVGCLAVGTLITPAAFAALPMWSIVGGALGGAAAMRPSRGPSTDAQDNAVQPDVSDTVRGAALYAVLLELQGRDEATITRVLDRTLPADDEHAAWSNPDDVRAFLDEMRHRFDLALTAEGRDHG